MEHRDQVCKLKSGNKSIDVGHLFRHSEPSMHQMELYQLAQEVKLVS